MKRITYICAILLSSVLMFSCSDYLEAPPSVDLDEDGVFADRTLTEQYITGIYAEGMPLGFSMGVFIPVYAAVVMIVHVPRGIALPPVCTFEKWKC